MFKHRLFEVDILRGLTFLAIVMQHTLASFIYNPQLTMGPALVSAFLLVTIRYAVPMFIFITGLVLFYNHSDEGFRYPEFIKKRFIQIFIPYAVWTVIYYFWPGGRAGGDIYKILADIGKLMLNGDACYHLWFMVAIMQFYLLFPFFRWMVLKLRNQAALTLSLLLLLYLALMWFNTYQAPALYEQIHAPWLKTLLEYRDRLFLTWFFYFVLGGYAGLYARNLRNILASLQRVNLYVFLLSFVLVLGAVVKTGRTDPAGHYTMNFLFTLPLTPAMVVYLVSSLITIYYLSLTFFMKNQLLNRVLKTYGRYSYGCYFVHAMVLYYANTFITAYLPSASPVLQLGLVFTVCAVISLLACYLMSRLPIPLANVLVGKISN
ncbi:MAG: acyltransferase [Syntrophomonadaceae bacterium]|nr:acyltransferase [Syntrophomonadaceae bacterium]